MYSQSSPVEKSSGRNKRLVQICPEKKFTFVYKIALSQYCFPHPRVIQWSIWITQRQSQWKKVKKYEVQSYLESYITEDEIVDRVLTECWSKSPVYLVTNSGVEYVKTAMDDNGLHPAGIICGDMVRAYHNETEEL